MFNRRTAFLSLSVGLTSLLVGACSNSHAHEMSTTSSPTTATTTKTAVQTIIDPWQPRFGRQRPVIAVLAVNSGTELTDYVIPFGVLSAADVADITTVSTGPGSVTMRPALRTQAQMTVKDRPAEHTRMRDRRAIYGTQLRSTTRHSNTPAVQGILPLRTGVVTVWKQETRRLGTNTSPAASNERRSPPDRSDRRGQRP